MVDAVGGVDIVPSIDYSYGSESVNDWVYLDAGKNVHLDGTCAFNIELGFLFEVISIHLKRHVII